MRLVVDKKGNEKQVPPVIRQSHQKRFQKLKLSFFLSNNNGRHVSIVILLHENKLEILVE